MSKHWNKPCLHTGLLHVSDRVVGEEGRGAGLVEHGREVEAGCMHTPEMDGWADGEVDGGGDRWMDGGWVEIAMGGVGRLVRCRRHACCKCLLLAKRID